MDSLKDALDMRRLMFCVLERGLKDIVKWHHPQHSKNASFPAYDDSIHWVLGLGIYAGNDDHVFSFTSICDHLDLPPENIKNKILRIVEGKDEHVVIINTALGDLNTFISLYARNINNIHDHVNPNTPPTYPIQLTRRDIRSTVSLGFAPYKLSTGDTLQVDDQVVVFDSPSRAVRSKNPWTESNTLNLGLSLAITYKGLTVRKFDRVGIPIRTKEEAEQYFYEELDGLDLDFEFDGDFFQFVLGSSILSVKVNHCGFQRVFNLPKKVTVSSSTVYTSTQELKNLIGGTITSEVVYRGQIELESGRLVAPQIEERRAIIIIGDTYIAYTGDAPLDLIAGTGVNFIDDYYKGPAKIIEEVLTLPNVEVQTVEGFGGVSSASYNPLAVQFNFDSEYTPVEGDSINGTVISRVDGTTLEVYSNMVEGEYTVTSSDYGIALGILSQLPTAISTLSGPCNSILDIARLESSVTNTVEIVESLLASVTEAKGSVRYREFCRILADMRNAHLSLGLDRALDMLYSGDLKSYMALQSHQGNYSKSAAISTRDVSRRMQSL